MTEPRSGFSQKKVMLDLLAGLVVVLIEPVYDEMTNGATHADGCPCEPCTAHRAESEVTVKNHAHDWRICPCVMCSSERADFERSVPMRVVCSYCNVVMREAPITPARVSHGVCPSCLARELAAIE